MRKVIFICLLLMSLTTRATTINFETELSEDKDFVNKIEEELRTDYSKLLKYFQVRLSKPLKIQILPYTKNPNFLSCARIYGPYRIYIHSLKSLKEMPVSERAKYNRFCFSRSYDDLYYTLLHEFVHSLTMINTNTGKIPRWIWEGIAVAKSFQLEKTMIGRNYLHRISQYSTVELCNSNISGKDVYSVGGPVWSFLESKYPNIILKLVKHLRHDSSFSKAKEFFSAQSISCSVDTLSVKKHLNKIMKNN